MQFRRARLDDYHAIVELQNHNLQHAITNLADGFLATAYSAEHFQQINETMAVVVCEDENKICGYLGACHIDFFKQFPIAAAMLNRLTDLRWRGAAIDVSRVLVANPVCIDHNYRGAGVYLKLCQTMIEYLPRQYDLAVTLVPVANQRSYLATSRLGFETLEQFELNGMKFHSMIISLREFERKFLIEVE